MKGASRKKGLPEKMVGLFHLFRPLNGLMAAAAVLIGWYVSSEESTAVPPVIPILMVSAFGFVSLANIANDLDDIAQDRKVHPRRALPSGSVDRTTAIVTMVLILSVVLVLFVLTALLNGGPITLAILVIGFFLIVLYERKAKDKGIIGNIIVALSTTLPFFLGASVPGISAKVILLCPMAFTINLTRELLKDVCDIEGDRGWRSSFPILYGVDRTLRASDMVMVLTIISSILPTLFWKVGPLYLVPVIVADFLFISASFISRTRVSLSVQLLKVGMVFGLLGFIFL